MSTIVTVPFALTADVSNTWLATLPIVPDTGDFTVIGAACTYSLITSTGGAGDVSFSLGFDPAILSLDPALTNPAQDWSADLSGAPIDFLGGDGGIVLYIQPTTFHTGSVTVEGVVTITLAGDLIMPIRVRVGSLAIHDVLNDAPNTASFISETRVQAGERLALSLDATTKQLAGRLGGVAIGAGTLDLSALLFRGPVVHVDQTYEADTPARRIWTATCLDDAVTLNQVRPFGDYGTHAINAVGEPGYVAAVTVSATDVAQDLMTAYAFQFGSTHVETGLPGIVITFDGTQTFGECLTAIVQAMGGGGWYLDYGDASDPPDLHLFSATTGDTSAPPDALPNALLLNNPPLTRTEDVSQLRNRVYVRGGGTTVAANVPVGATAIPLTDASRLPTSGTVIIGGQVYTLTGRTGPLTVQGRPGPTTPAVLSQGATDSVDPYPAADYGVTVSWVYPDGYESPIGPMSNILSADGIKQFDVDDLPVSAGLTRRVYVTIAGAAGETPDASDDDTSTLLTDVVDDSTTSVSADVPVWLVSTVEEGVFAVTAGAIGSQSGDWWAGSTGNDVNASGLTCSSGAYTNPCPGAFAVRWDAGVVTIDGVTIVDVAHLPTGFVPISGAVLGYLVADPATLPDPPIIDPLTFRFKAAGADVPLVGSTADTAFPFPQPTGLDLFGGFGINFTVAYPVGTPDMYGNTGFSAGGSQTTTFSGKYGRLVWTAPAGDKPSRAGILGKGATSLLVGDCSSFASGGGVAHVGSNLITYTGCVAGELLGIPATGAFSINCPIVPETTLTPEATPPTLIGDGLGGNGCAAGSGSSTVSPAVVAPIPNGTPVYLWVQRDDTASQTARAALELDDTGTPTTGIHEFTITDDTLITVADCEARGDAELEMFAWPLAALSYATRDPKTRSGKIVHLVDAINGDADFLIQQVDLDQIDEWQAVGGGTKLMPRLSVQATYPRFTLADLWRRQTGGR